MEKKPVYDTEIDRVRIFKQEDGRYEIMAGTQAIGHLTLPTLRNIVHAIQQLQQILLEESKNDA